MTATLYDLTASPHFNMTNRPPAVQPVAVPMSVIDRQAWDFWRAARSVRERRTFRSIIFGTRLSDEQTLWRLRQQGFMPTLRDRAKETLRESGCLIPMTPAPGPYNGSAA